MSETIDPVRAASLLAECISSVFADMAFIDVNPAHEGTPKKEGEEDRCVAIDVLSPLSCRIELKITARLRDIIVENLYGDSPDSKQKKNGEDSVLEMLNIIAGSFLSAYFGPGTEIQLELPRYLYFGEQSAGQAVTSIDMNAEGEPLSASLVSVRYRY